MFDMKAYQREWRKNNKDKIRGYRKKYRSNPISKLKEANYREVHKHKQPWYLRKHKYNITRGEWEKLFKEQGGVCKICSNPSKPGKSLHTDHSHKNGKVRGLLCNNCNLTLGKFEDNPEWLVKMISYIVENGWLMTMREVIKSQQVV